MSTKPASLGPWRVFALATVALGVGLCARERLTPTTAAPSPARALGIFSPDQPGVAQADGRLALIRDARRREARFRDAAQPGTSFASTRVREDELPRLPSEAMFELGAQLFHHRFTRQEGWGDASSTGAAALRRVHRGARGGPDAYTCAECHRRGGPAGAGDASDNAYLDGDGDRPASAVERNPPPLTGVGLIELLAREMSHDLAAIRRDATERAKARGEAFRAQLVSKGVDFGAITVSAAGALDVSEVVGIDRDLVVRPFGYKGHAASLRDIVEDELAIHHGMQSERLVRAGDTTRIGDFGLPDPDGDGVVDEVSDGQLAVLTLFTAMQEVPETDLPRRSDLLALWPIGEASFQTLGCAKCHVAHLPLESTVYTLELASGGKVAVDLARGGAAPRVVIPDEGGPARVYLFSDLKRHTMGPNLREGHSHHGVLASHFITRPLWGIARSRPYLHDARAPTLDDAILQHSGEALAARDAYAKLSDEERGPLRVFLMSQSRAVRLSSP